jgi:hypothetical protein
MNYDLSTTLKSNSISKELSSDFPQNKQIQLLSGKCFETAHSYKLNVTLTPITFMLGVCKSKLGKL